MNKCGRHHIARMNDNLWTTPNIAEFKMIWAASGGKGIENRKPVHYVHSWTNEWMRFVWFLVFRQWHFLFFFPSFKLWPAHIFIWNGLHSIRGFHILFFSLRIASTILCSVWTIGCVWAFFHSFVHPSKKKSRLYPRFRICLKSMKSQSSLDELSAVDSRSLSYRFKMEMGIITLWWWHKHMTAGD